MFPAAVERPLYDMLVPKGAASISVSQTLVVKEPGHRIKKGNIYNDHRHIFKA